MFVRGCCRHVHVAGVVHGPCSRAVLCTARYSACVWAQTCLVGETNQPIRVGHNLEEALRGFHGGNQWSYWLTPKSTEAPRGFWAETNGPIALPAKLKEAPRGLRGEPNDPIALPPKLKEAPRGLRGETYGSIGLPPKLKEAPRGLRGETYGH